MTTLFLTAFLLVLLPAGALRFGTDSREASDPRTTPRSLVS